MLVRGLNALAATVCTPLAAPVIAAVRLRGGNASSARGAASLITEAVAAAQDAGCAGTVVVRMDSAYNGAAACHAARRAGAFFSVTVRLDPAVRRVFADLTSGPLARAPSGRFAANAAWLTLAAIAHNLTRAAGALASPACARARGATIRRDLIHVGARIARHGRGHLTLHLPAGWHREHEWTQPVPRRLRPARDSDGLTSHAGHYHPSWSAGHPDTRPDQPTGQAAGNVSGRQTQPAADRQDHVRDAQAGEYPPLSIGGSGLSGGR